MAATDRPLDRLGVADVADLDGLGALVRAADPDGRLDAIGLRELRIGSGVLDALPRAVEALVPEGARVLVAGDATPIEAGGRDVKAGALELLAARFDAERVDLGADLHADEATIAAATEALAERGCRGRRRLRDARRHLQGRHGRRAIRGPRSSRCRPPARSTASPTTSPCC